MKLIIGLSVLSFVLFFTTALLVWYMRKILTKLLYVSESMGDFLITVDSYAEHLDSVYNLEMFYGDENLEKLLIHSKELVNSFIEFQSMYSDVEIEEEFEEETPGEEV